MGERLNIEIEKQGRVIANAYYHWSAYSVPAARMVLTILNSIEATQEHNEQLMAIRLLEATGAGLTPPEIENLPKELASGDFIVSEDRNKGLIAISEEGIEETRYYEEGRVSIDIEARTVHFGILSFVDDHDDKEKVEKSIDIDISCIAFGDFGRFEAFLRTVSYGRFETNDGVYELIA